MRFAPAAGTATTPADERPSLIALTPPSLPGAEPAITPPPPEAVPDDPASEPVPINPKTGLPTEPTGDVTATPPWKRRHRSAARRRARIVVGLAAVGVLLAAIWVGLSAYLPNDESPDAAPTPRVTAVDAASGEVTEATSVRPAVATLRNELEDGQRASRFTAGPVKSYSFTLVDPFGFVAAVRVDTDTGNMAATATPSTEIRRVDGRHFGRFANGPWIELSAEAASSIPPMLVAGPLVVEDVLPSALADFVVAERELAGGELEVVLDGERLAAGRSVEWERWLAQWGLPAASAAPAAGATPAASATPGDPAPSDAAAVETAAASDVVIVVGAEPDRTVTVALISSPSIGGTLSYSLRETRGTPMRVDAPELAVAD